MKRITQQSILRMFGRILNPSIPRPLSLPRQYVMNDVHLVYVLPISGPYFPLQLTALYLLQGAFGTIGPNLILGSSGGAIVGALGLGAGWDAQNIRDSAGRLSAKELYVKTGPYLPNTVNWLLTGAVMLPSTNVYEVGRRILKDRLKQQSELVVGTYCIQTHTVHLFSGRGPHDSHLPEGTIHTYLDGDWECMTRALVASAAVPCIIPPIKVKRNSPLTFQDGGVYSPSPWSSVWRQVISRPGRLKLVYFVSSMDVPIPAFNTLEPLVRLVNNASLRELADIQDSFRMRLNSQGSGSEMRSFTQIQEAVQAFMTANEALLIIKPFHERRRYNFDLFGFVGKELLGVVDRFRDFEFEVIMSR